MKISKPRQQIRSRLLICLCLLVFPSAALPTENDLEPMQRMSEATEIAADSQKAMESWLAEKEQLLQSMQDSRLELEHLRYREKKYLFQIKKERNILEELDRERQEAERMLMGLEPELAARVDILEQRIDADLPFLKQEREERTAMLRESVMDHRIGLDVKLRRVLEAYLIEAGYGRSVESLTRNIDLAGQPTTVRIFRLGRLGLFYLTMDNSAAGRWSRTNDEWVPLPRSMISPLNTAIDIANRKRAAELVELPAGRP